MATKLKFKFRARKKKGTLLHGLKILESKDVTVDISKTWVAAIKEHFDLNIDPIFFCVRINSPGARRHKLSEKIQELVAELEEESKEKVIVVRVSKTPRKKILRGTSIESFAITFGSGGTSEENLGQLRHEFRQIKANRSEFEILGRIAPRITNVCMELFHFDDSNSN